MTGQQRQEHLWMHEKRAAALLLSKALAEPPLEKQDIGRISLQGFSSDAVEKSTMHFEKQIRSCPTNIICLPLHAVLLHPTYHELFQKYFSTLVPADTFYHALHYAHATNILFIYIPKDVEADRPLHIVKHAAGITALHHLLVIAEPLSKLTIIQEESAASCPAGYASTIVEASVQEGAHITHVALQEYPETFQQYAHKHAVIAKDGRMDWIEAYFGGAYTRATATATLREDGASSTNTTVFFGEGTQKFDIISRTIQVGKHTFADMNTVGVVADHSKAMCRGLIKIAQPSFGSSGNQKIKTLLMNKDAQANAIPSMEIDNFDVRATHESSVGQINKDKLFYLMSRGFDEQHARMKIVEGYFAQLAKLIPDKHIEQKVMALIRKKLHMETEEEQEEHILEHYEEENVYA